MQSNFDRRVWAPTPDVAPWTLPVTYCVDATRPNDSGDGLTWASAKRAISAAIAAGNAQSSPYIVLVRAGTYNRNLCPTGPGGTVVPNKACVVQAVGGRVETGFFDDVAWTLDQGATYRTARSNVRRMIDLSITDARGLYLDLTWAGSLAACRATPGSWWTDDVNLYATRADGAPVTNANTRGLMIVGGTGPLRMSTGGNMFVNGIDLQGGMPMLLTGSPTNRFVAEDCSARYSAGEDGIIAAANNARDGVTVGDVRGAAFIRCDASANQKDGFNSRLAAGVQPFMFTSKCTGFNNGRPGSTSCNGLTTHDGCKAIDEGGVYADNAGGQIAIVHNDTQLWCIDTFAYDSRGDVIFGGSVPPTDFLVDQGTPTLFLDNCAADGSRFPLYARNGTIEVRGGKFLGDPYTSNGGTIRRLS